MTRVNGTQPMIAATLNTPIPWTIACNTTGCIVSEQLAKQWPVHAMWGHHPWNQHHLTSGAYKMQHKQCNLAEPVEAATEFHCGVC